ncbi:hypothetical protein V5F49_18330 [Xanthobacter sp. V3C-3]|uniref:hypothetical protein n=1 Tax=Xanthobacter lutulentifluminis TaxID=3119935 RepID=UPI00372C6D8A
MRTADQHAALSNAARAVSVPAVDIRVVQARARTMAGGQVGLVLAYRHSEVAMLLIVAFIAIWVSLGWVMGDAIWDCGRHAGCGRAP